MLRVAVARSSAGGVAMSYILPVLWMTSCYHIMDPMGRVAIAAVSVLIDACCTYLILKLRNYWTKVHQILHDIDKRNHRCYQRVHLHSNYFNPFRNASATDKGEYRPILPLKLVSMVTTLERLEEEDQIFHGQSITYHMAKIGENRSIRSGDTWSPLNQGHTNFRRIVRKVSKCHIVNFGIIGPNPNKFLHDVVTSSPLLMCTL